MTAEVSPEPTIVQVDKQGKLVLSNTVLSLADLREGDELLILSPGPGQLCLYRTNAPEPLSREELGALMRETFQDSGYTTREHVLNLVRETKQELAEE
jgi:hypothetical protein